MKRNRLYAALCVLFAPAAALAFDAADGVVYPSSGRFPAYPPELTGVVAPGPTRPSVDVPGAGIPGSGRPTTVWAQFGVMRDNNVLRLPEKQSDTVFRYGVGARHEARISRQTIVLAADAAYYDFDRFNGLDHLAYGLLAEARWELGRNLSGTAGYSRRQALADLGELRSPVDDLIVTDRGYLRAAYRLTPDFRVRGALEAFTTSREGDARVGIDTDTRSGTIGLDYVTPLGNSIGVEARRTDGELTPLRDLATPIGSHDYKETEVSAVLTYAPGLRTRVTGRLGQTEREFEAFPGRNFKGGTGRLSVEWGVTPRTIVEGELWREARSILDVAASFVDSRGWSIGPRWAPTAKIAVSAHLMEEERRYNAADAVLVLLVPSGPRPTEEKIQLLRLGVGYELTRRITLALGWDNGKRSSDVSARDYDYSALSLNARWVF